MNEFEKQLVKIENDIYDYKEEKQKRILHREKEIEYLKSLEPSIASKALSGLGSLIASPFQAYKSRQERLRIQEQEEAERIQKEKEEAERLKQEQEEAKRLEAEKFIREYEEQQELARKARERAERKEREKQAKAERKERAKERKRQKELETAVEIEEPVAPVAQEEEEEQEEQGQTSGSSLLSGLGSLGRGTATLLGKGLYYGGRGALSVVGTAVETVAIGAVQVLDANTRRSERIQQQREEERQLSEQTTVSNTSTAEEREARRQLYKKKDRPVAPSQQPSLPSLSTPSLPQEIEEVEEVEETPEEDARWREKYTREKNIKEAISKLYTNTEEFKETMRGWTHYQKTKHKKQVREDILSGNLKPLLTRDEIKELKSKIKQEGIDLKRGELENFYRSYS